MRLPSHVVPPTGMSLFLPLLFSTRDDNLSPVSNQESRSWGEIVGNNRIDKE